MLTTRDKEDFVDIMLQASLSDYEFVIMAKKLGLDGLHMSTTELGVMFSFDKSLVGRIFRRAINKCLNVSDCQYFLDKAIEESGIRREDYFNEKR